MLMTSQHQTTAFAMQQAAIDLLSSMNAPKSRRLRSKSQATNGPLWSVGVPGAKGVVPHILSYGRNDGVKMFGDIWHISEAKALTDGVLVNWVSRSTFDAPSQMASFTLPYFDSRIRSAALGQWTNIGNGVEVKFDPQSIIPSVTPVGDGVHLSWQSPPLARWNNWFLRRIQVRVDRVVLHPTGGSVSVSPRSAGFVAPEFTWE